DLAALKKGLVRCAAFPSAAAMLLPPTLARMDKDYPGIELGFTECEPPEALEGVRGNNFDVAMIFRYAQTSADENESLEWTPILADPVRLILPRDHPLASRDDISMRDLKNEAWVAGCDRCSANLRHHAQVAGFTPNIRYCTDDSTVAQRLVGHGTGVVALLPEIALEAYPNDTVVIKEVTELDNRVIGIVNRPGALKIPAIAAFVNTLRHNANAHGCTLTHAHVHLDTGDLSDLEALADSQPARGERRQLVSATYQRIADALLQLGNPGEALGWADKDLQTYGDLAGIEQTAPDRQRDVASSLDRRAQALDLLGRHDEALAVFQRGVALLDRAMAAAGAEP
ncbi:MAG: LysR substrate-binding domain-containing protein, partial [Dermabacter sp.]|nr:LysR substrate-binding domain-containing protein [Dermabacter sp.]